MTTDKIQILENKLKAEIAPSFRLVKFIGSMASFWTVRISIPYTHMELVTKIEENDSFELILEKIKNEVKRQDIIKSTIFK